MPYKKLWKYWKLYWHQQSNFFKKKKKRINGKVINNKETCPIFNKNSSTPKLKFDHQKPFGTKKLFAIDRNLLSCFGFPQYGVHLNGWSFKNKNYYLHLAKRSEKLYDFPGLYDNLVAGGQPLGLSIYKNLRKEAYEEAGLIKIKIKNLIKSKTINYFHEHKNKVHSGIIFIYHLKINDEKFTNIDGEVENFESINAMNIYKLLELKLLKPNCIIPIADFFLTFMSDLFPKKAILELRNLFESISEKIRW